MYTGLTVLTIIMAYMIVRYRPVRGLQAVDRAQLCEMKREDEVQLLDVRDPVDYEAEHLNGALNIYVGRLPYVSLQELQQGMKVVIVSTSGYQIRRAARVLIKHGYCEVYGYLWRPSEQDRINGTSKPCCA